MIMKREIMRLKADTYYWKVFTDIDIFLSYGTSIEHKAEDSFRRSLATSVACRLSPLALVLQLCRLLHSALFRKE